MTVPRPKPRVSVLMTVLNAHPVYFPKAVRSILEQTLPDFELLIIEDPSSRPAEPLLRRFNDPRIHHFLNPQRTSLIQQKNQGLAAASSDLVALFDADDIAEPERLEKQVHFLEGHPEVMVLGSQIQIIDSEQRPKGYRQFPLHHEDIMRALPSFVPLSHPSVMLRKGPVLDAGGYRFREYPVAEDYELWSRLAQCGALRQPPRSLAALPRPLGANEIHASALYHPGYPPHQTPLLATAYGPMGESAHLGGMGDASASSRTGPTSVRTHSVSPVFSHFEWFNHLPHRFRGEW